MADSRRTAARTCTSAPDPTPSDATIPSRRPPCAALAMMKTMSAPGNDIQRESRAANLLRVAQLMSAMGRNGLYALTSAMGGKWTLRKSQMVAF